MVDGIPVLVDEARSIFSTDGVTTGGDGYFPSRSRWLRAADRLTPALALNVAARRNVEFFLAELHRRSRQPVVLVVGGAIVGRGIDRLLADGAVSVVETDVSLGPRTQIVCDAHHLPFPDGSFDGVVIQAVLEHVVDPKGCVDEIHRVLRPDGLVYAEAAFMQPVHGGRYDFTRFSHAGLRHLFRRFDELESGVACGPGSALAYAIVYFLQSFFRRRTPRKLIGRFARLAASPLKYFDLFLARREPAVDGASALYIVARRADAQREPRAVVAAYRGGQ